MFQLSIFIPLSPILNDPDFVLVETEQRPLVLKNKPATDPVRLDCRLLNSVVRSDDWCTSPSLSSLMSSEKTNGSLSAI